MVAKRNCRFLIFLYRRKSNCCWSYFLFLSIIKSSDQNFIFIENLQRTKKQKHEYAVDYYELKSSTFKSCVTDSFTNWNKIALFMVNKREMKLYTRKKKRETRNENERSWTVAIWIVWCIKSGRKNLIKSIYLSFLQAFEVDKPLWFIVESLTLKSNANNRTTIYVIYVSKLLYFSLFALTFPSFLLCWSRDIGLLALPRNANVKTMEVMMIFLKHSSGPRMLRALHTFVFVLF